MSYNNMYSTPVIILVRNPSEIVGIFGYGPNQVLSRQRECSRAAESRSSSASR